MKVLQMIDCAWRATLEEQDDTVVWITHAMKGAGAELDVLLMGGATGYAVQGQDAGGLELGGWRQTQPPRVGDDLAGLLATGSRVFVSREDADARGLHQATLIEGVEALDAADLAALVDRYDAVWRW